MVCRLSTFKAATSKQEGERRPWPSKPGRRPLKSLSQKGTYSSELIPTPAVNYQTSLGGRGAELRQDLGPGSGGDA